MFRKIILIFATLCLNLVNASDSAAQDQEINSNVIKVASTNSICKLPANFKAPKADLSTPTSNSKNINIVKRADINDPAKTKYPFFQTADGTPISVSIGFLEKHLDQQNAKFRVSGKLNIEGKPRDSVDTSTFIHTDRLCTITLRKVGPVKRILDRKATFRVPQTVYSKASKSSRGRGVQMDQVYQKLTVSAREMQNGKLLVYHFGGHNS